MPGSVLLAADGVRALAWQRACRGLERWLPPSAQHHLGARAAIAACGILDEKQDQAEVAIMNVASTQTSSRHTVHLETRAKCDSTWITKQGTCTMYRKHSIKNENGLRKSIGQEGGGRRALSGACTDPPHILAVVTTFCWAVAFSEPGSERCAKGRKNENYVKDRKERCVKGSGLLCQEARGG
eukprot:1157384-Pelagomonas_calceolata.AAC.8